MTLASEHPLTLAVGLATVATGGERDMTDINTLISERFGRMTDVGRGRDVEMLTKILEHRFGKSEFYGWSEAAARRLSAPATEISFRDFSLSHGFDLE